MVVRWLRIRLEGGLPAGDKKKKKKRIRLAMQGHWFDPWSGN